MNNERRKRIAEIVSTLEELHSRAEEIANEECEYYDNMPESLQGSDKGSTADEVATALEDAANSMQEALDYYGGIEL